MDKITINLKAAKMYGHPSHFKIDGDIYSEYPVRLVNNAWIPFDIFTNPADREATVIALGEKHGVSLAYLTEDDEWKAGWYIIYYEHGTDDAGHTTYTEALAKACESVILDQ